MPALLLISSSKAAFARHFIDVAPIAKNPQWCQEFVSILNLTWRHLENDINESLTKSLFRNLGRTSCPLDASVFISRLL